MLAFVSLLLTLQAVHGSPPTPPTQALLQDHVIPTVLVAAKKPTANPKSIVLKETLVLKTADLLAFTVSRLLHADVRVPLLLKAPVRLPEGHYTAARLLSLLAEQLCAGEQQMGEWHRVFVFTSRTAPADSLLPSAGTLTLQKQNASFVTIVRAAAKEVGCTVELPFAVPGRYNFEAYGVPVERSLERIASRVGLSVRTALTFNFDTETAPSSTGTLPPFSSSMTGDNTPIVVDASGVLDSSELGMGDEPLDLSAPSEEIETLTPAQLEDYSIQALSWNL